MYTITDMGRDPEPFIPLLPLVGTAAASAASAGATKLILSNSGAKWTKGERGQGMVSFFADTHLRGNRRDFPGDVRHVQNSLSKGTLGLGFNKENDIYSSAIVPPNTIVTIFEHNDLKGNSKVLYPGEHRNLGTYGFNDKVSSFIIEPQAPPPPPPPQTTPAPVEQQPEEPVEQTPVEPESLLAEIQSLCTEVSRDPAYQYTRRTKVDGQWVCPDGFVDTGCGWSDTGLGELQCKRPLPTCSITARDPGYTYTTRTKTDQGWACPDGYDDTGCGWEHGKELGPLQCQKKYVKPVCTVTEPEPGVSYTTRVRRQDGQKGWTCPAGYEDTGCGWEHGRVRGSLQCRKV